MKHAFEASLLGMSHRDFSHFGRILNFAEKVPKGVTDIFKADHDRPLFRKPKIVSHVPITRKYTP